MKQRLYLYPLWLRIWHWSNALLFFALMLSGISLHYARLDSPFLAFGTARILHNICGVLLSLMYLGFLLGNIRSGNWKHYLPSFRGLPRRLFKQASYYGSGIFKGEPHPYHPSEKEKFNPLQQLTYLTIMFFFMPILVLSGLVLLVPEHAPDKVFGLGGIWPMAVLHSIVAFLLTIFMVGHIYLATTGETIWTDVQEMITGWHTVNHKEEMDNGPENAV